MSFEFVKKLPTPSEIKEQYPVPEKLVALKKERDQAVSYTHLTLPTIA